MRAPDMDNGELKSVDAGDGRSWRARRGRTDTKEKEVVAVAVKEEHEDALNVPTLNAEAESEVIHQITPPPIPDDESHTPANPVTTGPRKRRTSQSRPEREAAQGRRLKLADFEPLSN